MRPVNLPDTFGCDVFHEAVMKQRLEPEIFCAWKACVRNGSTLEASVADAIAEAMKQWAMEKGATHYTHWFQPMTGVTAEKHDSFISLKPGGKVVMDFTGKALIQGEPDASSFPSGGLRATFEARGYTVWDPSSFAFVKDGSLHIPTCFFSCTGAALDKKTPLLRSIDEVNREALRVLKILGDKETRQVTPSAGAEQEYFLITKEDWAKRMDLRLAGRTLFGAPAPKGQELDDHYLCSISPKVSAYMRELDETLWRLGIPAKTKHNEAAPCQHELAPVYTDANKACDDNQLIMETMKQVADRHGLVCLLHEKPFAGINGSGKHVNWSISTDTGRNLFEPGNTPEQSARFLLFLAAFVKGVDEYQELLRCSAASAGNDCRLGSAEAPPAIVSLFLGDDLCSIVDSIAGNTDGQDPRNSIRIGVDVLPTIPRDTADRNRTAPIAFTGNKFEFRMPGAGQSISGPIIVLNTIMAHELKWFADRLESSRKPKLDLHRLVAQCLSRHRRILFSGNCYDPSWFSEARSRGLPLLPHTPACLDVYLSPQNMKLVAAHRIFTPEEFRARQKILGESYCKTCRIEALTMIHMLRRQILPGIHKGVAAFYQVLLQREQLRLSCHTQRELAERITALTDELYLVCVKLEQAVEQMPPSGNGCAHYCQSTMYPLMKQLRSLADHLEQYTEKTSWPFPAYSDLLFFS